MQSHRADKAFASSLRPATTGVAPQPTPSGGPPRTSQVAAHAPTRLAATRPGSPYPVPVSPSAWFFLGADRPAARLEPTARPSPRPQQVAPPIPATQNDPTADACASAALAVGQVHGAPHHIVAGGRRLARNALFAEMDEDLVVARAGSGASGVCSMGFATCAALVFRRGDAVGLAHSSRIDLVDVIADARAQFEAQAGDARGRTEVAIGYSTQGYRADLSAEIDHLTLPKFWREHEKESPGRRRAVVPATKEDAIRIVLARHVRRIEAVARQVGAATFDMPHGMLFMPVRGSVRVFEGEAQEPDIVPARE